MDATRQLEALAKEAGLALTPLADFSRYSRSGKVTACGGTVLRVETESASDSTVCLRDGSGTCLCALHGDVTSRYPDTLSAGAVMLLTDITVIVTGAKMPPLLIACLGNLSGLLLPEAEGVSGAPVPPYMHQQSSVFEALEATKKTVSAAPHHQEESISNDIAVDEAAVVDIPVCGVEPQQIHVPAVPVPAVTCSISDDEDCLELADDL